MYLFTIEGVINEIAIFLRSTTSPPPNENGSGSRSDSQAQKSLSMGVAAQLHFYVCVRLKITTSVLKALI